MLKIIDLNRILKTELTHFVHVLLKSSQLSIFYLRCYYYSALRISFLNDLNDISPKFALLPVDVFVKTLLYGNPIFDESDCQKILETSIRYILDSKDLVEVLYNFLYHLFAIVLNNIKKLHWSLIFISFHFFSLFTVSLADNYYRQGFVPVGTVLCHLYVIFCRAE